MVRVWKSLKIFIVCLSSFKSSRAGLKSYASGVSVSGSRLTSETRKKKSFNTRSLSPPHTHYQPAYQRKTSKNPSHPHSKFPPIPNPKKLNPSNPKTASKQNSFTKFSSNTKSNNNLTKPP